MTNIPADAPRSEDGFYWWDGTQWLPVADASQSTTPETATPGEIAGTADLPAEFELIHTWGTADVGETDVPEMSDDS